MTPEELAEYQEWVASRPPRVRDVLAKVDGWTAYRMKHADGGYAGALYILVSVNEPIDDSPCTVKVLRVNEATGLPMHTVFGVNPDKLEPVGPAHRREDGTLGVLRAQ